MRKILTEKTKNILTALLFTLAFSGLVNASETTGTKTSINKHACPADTLVFKKILIQQTRTTIKLYPNPSNGIVHVSNNNNQVKESQFYIFDLEGTMIQNIRLTGKERKTITGLSKGIYVYEVFVYDKSVERGKIVVE